MPTNDLSTDSDTPIVRFYRGVGPDACGRSIDDILRWDDERLENVHDFIQWLFPLDEPSRFNPAAPILTSADRAAFHADARLAANLRRSFERMLAFYGLALEESDTGRRVGRSPRWDERSSTWLISGNHNLLRLTRIMKSLMLLGMPELARALYAGLKEEAERVGAPGITAETLRYWQAAVGQ